MSRTTRVMYVKTAVPVTWVVSQGKRDDLNWGDGERVRVPARDGHEAIRFALMDHPQWQGTPVMAMCCGKRPTKSSPNIVYQEKAGEPT